jgi:hypothetical protein
MPKKAAFITSSGRGGYSTWLRLEGKGEGAAAIGGRHIFLLHLRRRHLMILAAAGTGRFHGFLVIRLPERLKCAGDNRKRLCKKWTECRMCTTGQGNA